MQNFPVSIIKILDNLGFFGEKYRKSLGFLFTILKILQNLTYLVENNCPDVGKKCQKSKISRGKKTKTSITVPEDFTASTLQIFRSNLSDQSDILTKKDYTLLNKKTKTA